jgi:hypothetical protein
MRRHVEGVLQAVFPAKGKQEAFKGLLSDLYLAQPDGTLTTALVPVRALREKWGAGFDELLTQVNREEFRLLKLTDRRSAEGTEQVVSLGHDALAPVAAEWRAEREERKRVRVYAWSVAGAFVLASAMGTLALWAKDKSDQATAAEKEAIEQKEKADKKAREAIEAEQKVKNQYDELISSRERLNRTLVKALLGPIQAEGRDAPLTPYEVETFWQIAGLRREPVSLTFLEEATQTPLTCTQFESRAEYVLHAIVGLDRDRHDQVDRLLLVRMRGALEPTQSVSLALACSRWGDSSSALAAQVADILLAALGKETNPYTRQRFVKGLLVVIRGFSTQEYRRAQDSLALTTGPSPRPIIFCLHYSSSIRSHDRCHRRCPSNY